MTYVYRYQPAEVQAQLARDTKGTIWMPRDIIISAARGRAWLIQDENGRTYFPMAFQQDVSESLDAIGQFPGMMLYRGTDLWVPIPGGTPGQTLIYVSDDDPPEWSSSPLQKYQCLHLIAGTGSVKTIVVNSTSYVFKPDLTYTWSYEDLPFDQFRILVSGSCNQAAQTCTVQLAPVTDINAPLRTGGNDLVIGSTGTLYDSGWLDVDNPPADFVELTLAIKGSNSTVDLTPTFIDVHMRKN